MALYEYAHDLDTPVHPVSAPDYMPAEQLRALQLHRLQGLVRRVYDNVPLTRQRMAERGVSVEANPTSNLVIGNYARYSDLPFARIV